MEKELLIKVLKNIKFKVFDNELNIVGVRKSFILDNKFSDELYVWSDKVPFRKYTITTKPGKYWWENFGMKSGVAALVENQYIDTWSLGLHRGKYEALVQVKDVVVYRDGNKNQVLDLTKTEKGLFGINIHRSSDRISSPFVNLWSAGCMVFQNPKEYKEFIQICKDSKQKEFTYSLINQKIIDKFMNYTIQLKKKSDKGVIVLYRKSNDNKLICLGSITELNVLNTILGETFKKLGIDDIMTIEDSIGKQLETMPLGEVPSDLKLENSI